MKGAGRGFFPPFLFILLFFYFFLVLDSLETFPSSSQDCFCEGNVVVLNFCFVFVGGGGGFEGFLQLIGPFLVLWGKPWIFFFKELGL